MSELIWYVLLQHGWTQPQVTRFLESRSPGDPLPEDLTAPVDHETQHSQSYGLSEGTLDSSPESGVHENGA